MGDTHDDGLADQGLAAYIDRVRAEPGPSARELGVAAMRAAAVRRGAARARGPELVAVVDLRVPGEPDVAVRLYRPTTEPRPLLVFFHGGGWTIGDLESHDSICRRLARAADAAVLAVDYRRGPEHPWPAAVDDAVTVLRWARTEAPALVGAGHVGVG